MIKRLKLKTKLTTVVAVLILVAVLLNYSSSSVSIVLSNESTDSTDVQVSLSGTTVIDSVVTPSYIVPSIQQLEVTNNLFCTIAVSTDISKVEVSYLGIFTKYLQITLWDDGTINIERNFFIRNYQ